MSSAHATAQTSVGGPPPSLVMLPYEEPGSTDPYATGVTRALMSGFEQAGMRVKLVAPVDHLQAIANARKLCADNGSRGILVAAGRYEQTPEQVVVGAVPIGRRPDLSHLQHPVLAYPTHVELRLDEVGCDGVVRWTTTTTDDETLPIADRAQTRGVGKLVDVAFLQAAHDAAAARAAATVAEPPPPSTAQARTQPSGAPSMYILLPYQQPGIADAHATQITHSLFMRLQRKNIVVDTVPAMDHFEVFARGPGLCAETGAQAIIVPDLRVEQSEFSKSAHASLRLSLLGCNGSVRRQASAEAEIMHPVTWNPDSLILEASEHAMDDALAQLFPDAPVAAH